jgi:hypothetical protein
MTSASPKSAGGTLIAYLFYPVFIAGVSLPSVKDLGWRGAISLSLVALAWLIFARLILFGAFGAALAAALSRRTARIALSLLIDFAGMWAAFRIGRSCIWSGLVAVSLAEAMIAVAPDA